ncbi:L-cystine transporter-like protein [Aureobasidium pullulans]|uniref:L-cystine transporter-like protein n=1 Tax=Aureobasidium pullulans TaxID=5580 RepID=A0A4S9CW69_AURPU|nr:L-cystine transporter-like protein [Aureobasidium pullulans]
MYAVTGEDVARAISWLLGWSYFTSWSLSFYPQPLRCWKRRSTRGITVDFPLLNIVGFTSYFISTTSFLFSPEIRQQYAVRHPFAPEPTVRFNDLVFALHGTIVCFVFYSQFYPRLWNFEVVKGQRASSTALGIFYGSIIGVAITVLLVSLFKGGRDTADSWADIDVIYAFSYVKIIITLSKYTPQAWYNYKIKSTAGWAIDMIWLDFIGGVMSLLQLIIDSALQADWSGITGNPAKLFLAMFSLCFDMIFFVQHYVLYKGNELPSEDEEEDATRPLLG